MFGSLIGVESFTSKKVIGVLATLAGVILTSGVDLSGKNDNNRGTFPHKSQKQIAFGDALAFTSSVVYGIYTSVLKKKAGNEERVNMPLFFGFVGIFNMITLLPGLIVFHFANIEKFQVPPTRRILAIVLVRWVIAIMNLDTNTHIRSTRSFLLSLTSAGLIQCYSRHQLLSPLDSA